MTRSLAPLFDWRSAVASKHGPESSTTRHVLLTLSLWMSPKGDSCYPSTRTMAEATGLSRRTVETHLRTAEEQGWIVRDVHGYGGRGWKRYEYLSRIPRSVISAISEQRKGGEPLSPRSREGGETDAEGGETDDEKVGNLFPISSPVRESIESIRGEDEKGSQLEIEETTPRLPHPSKLKRNGKGLLYPDEFEAIWQVYPDRRGSNPKKGAYRAWRSTVCKGVSIETLQKSVEGYRRFAEAEGIIGKPTVMMAQTFFGPDERWAEEWDDEVDNVDGGHWGYEL